MVKPWVFLVLSCFAITPLCSMSKARSTPVQNRTDPYVGVRTFQYVDSQRSRNLFVEFWYPTDTPGAREPSVDSVWVHPEEMRNAPLSPDIAARPLIVMSHGHRGDRRELSWLAERLVREGYLVAAVEHPGNNRFHFDLLMSLKFWDRAKDVTFVLDRLLIDPLLQPLVNRAKIGFVGYSLGGMTGLGLAGASLRPIDLIMKATAGKHRDLTPELIAKVDPIEARQNVQEKRIGAFLLICPASFAYEPTSFVRIKTPLALVAALNDEVLPHQEHASQIIAHLRPVKTKLISDPISHYAFLNRVSEVGKRVLHRDVYTDPPCCNREAIHREVGSFAVDFFSEFLTK